MEAGAGPTTLLLPAGARLLHIGPPKTGTTALQAAFWAARDEARAQGVRYAGRSRHPASAMFAVTGRKLPSTGEVPPIRHWLELLDEVRRAREPRVVISSEGFAYARPAVVRRVVEDLDPARVHVVLTLRPVARMLQSVWQEQAQSGSPVPFGAWLDSQLNAPTGSPTPYLWRLHRHDALVDRWAEVVGAEKVTVVVVDDRDRAAVLRAFERLVGLREGTLALVPDLANRSLTLPEIEAVRALNVVFTAEGLSNAQFHDIVRMGAAAYMKTRRPTPGEPRIETPQWALDRAGEVAREIVAGIAVSGVRVVGDLDSLADVPASGVTAERVAEVPIPAEVAASLAMGMAFATGLARPGAAHDQAVAAASGATRPSPGPEPPLLARIPSHELAGVLVRRTRRAAARRLAALRRRFT